MFSQALILWAALLLMAARSAVQAQVRVPAGCDSERELLTNLEWLKKSCPHETFADGFTLVPQAITTADCAEVVRRVASECGGLLGSSDWFQSRKAALDAAVVSAAALPDDQHSRGVYALADPSVTVVHTCGATLTDGFADFAPPATGQSRVTIDVGPSNGHVRLALDAGTTLDADFNDNLHVYDAEHEVAAIYSGDLPVAAPIGVSGSVAEVLLVSDGASRRTSLRATVECVCEDSVSFSDVEGDGCVAYTQVSGTKHSRCDAVTRVSCPLACGACEPDSCASSPCLNGGTCTEGRDSATCKTSDLTDRLDNVMRACCNEPTEDCSNGQPASCNGGCAAVLVPYYLDCWQALGAEPGGGEVLAMVQRAVQQCESLAQAYRCSCTAGYSGENCEIQPPSPPSAPDGFDDSYTLSGCRTTTYCGLFRRVDAHCTDIAYGMCPGGANARYGWADATLCDGAPVYQQGGANGPVLYRYGGSGGTVWVVGDKGALRDCGANGVDYYYRSQYPSLNLGSLSPDATIYGWSGPGGYSCQLEQGCFEHGTIHVVGGGGH